MPKIIKRCDYLPERHDLDDDIVYRNLASSRNEPNQPFNGVIPDHKTYLKAMDIAGNVAYEHEIYYTQKTVEKWSGPQGGSYSQEQLEANMPEYYAERSVNSSSDEEDDYVRTIRLALRKARVDLMLPDDIITTSPRRLYNTYKADHKSSGGVSGKDRRAKETRVKAIKSALDMPTQYDPIEGLMRYKDGKYRNIFNDSLANYFRENIVLNVLFQWIHQCPWDMHYSDIECQKIITRCNSKASWCGDYEGMDFHFSYDDIDRLIDEMTSVFSLDASQVSYVRMSLEELFYADLLLGDKVYMGKHNLFSGIYPTHDIEFFRNFFNMLYAPTKMGFELSTGYRKLSKNQFYVMICGDDSVVLFGRELTSEERTFMTNETVRIAAMGGQKLEWSKVEYSTTVANFCKKTFALRPNIKGFKINEDHNVIPFYAVNKAVHALRMPEKIPNFPEKKDLIIWFCSIMDCAYGGSTWKSTVIYLIQHNSDLFGQVNDVKIDNDILLLLNDDWWFRNYAQFELEKSPTFQLIKSLMK